jgi:hypothetical protein
MNVHGSMRMIVMGARLQLNSPETKRTRPGFDNCVDDDADEFYRVYGVRSAQCESASPMIGWPCVIAPQ